MITSDRPQPTHEEIATLAYVMWLEAGCPEGTDEEHWCSAEQKLIKAATKKPRKKTAEKGITKKKTTRKKTTGKKANKKKVAK